MYYVQLDVGLQKIEHRREQWATEKCNEKYTENVRSSNKERTRDKKNFEKPSLPDFSLSLFCLPSHRFF